MKIDRLEYEFECFKELVLKKIENIELELFNIKYPDKMPYYCVNCNSIMKEREICYTCEVCKRLDKKQ